MLELVGLVVSRLEGDEVLLDERAEQVVDIRPKRVGRELDERRPREHGADH